MLDKQILDIVLITNEAIHYRMKSIDGWFIWKLDIEKGFDFVN